MMPQNIAKLKKQEEEMDSDERLLASEEGKKLSSKERRQLRNKVSARAFRSRRKEYISSLEAEVAKKAADNVALANDNERLLRENERLENLSRMLLQAPAFHSFMDELTSMGGAKAQGQQQQPQQQQARVSKPEPTASAPAPADWALAYNNWNPSPQVFRVELPEPPHLQQLLRDQQPKSSTCDSLSIAPEEDYSICDGFFADIRNENADFSMSSYAPEEPTYTPPENLSEVVRGLEDEKPRKEAEQRASYKGENLDNLFPGVGVNNLLERIEKVASGEPAEQHFEELADTDTNNSPPAQQQRTQQHTDQQRAQDNRFKEAAGVYRRIGLMVQ